MASCNLIVKLNISEKLKDFASYSTCSAQKHLS